MDSGIYKILNLINGNTYIGSAVNIKKRIWLHKWQLRNKKHANTHLQKSFDKYGEDNFSFNTVEFCDYSKCIEREQFYIDSINPEYNICKTAGSVFGIKRSPETIKKLSEAAYNRVPISDETRKKLSDSHKGKRLSPESQAKRVASVTGQKRSPETCRKISESNIGKAHPDHVKKALLVANLGKKHTKEHIDKRTKKLIGRKHSEESKEKMRISIKQKKCLRD
jgi:group I intron endonuclease